MSNQAEELKVEIHPAVEKAEGKPIVVITDDVGAVNLHAAIYADHSGLSNSIVVSVPNFDLESPSYPIMIDNAEVTRVRLNKDGANEQLNIIANALAQNIEVIWVLDHEIRLYPGEGGIWGHDFLRQLSALVENEVIDFSNLKLIINSARLKSQQTDDNGIPSIYAQVIAEMPGITVTVTEYKNMKHLKDALTRVGKDKES